MKFYFLLIALSFVGLNSIGQHSYGKEIVAKLTSNEFKGRGYVGKGDSIAAHFLAAEFKKLGAKPIGNNKDYFQSFNLDVNTIPEICAVSINGTALITGVDFLPQAKGGSCNQTFTKFIEMNVSNFGDVGRQIEFGKTDAEVLIINSLDTKDRDTMMMFHELTAYFSNKIPIIVVNDSKFTHTVSTRSVKHPVLEIKKEFLKDLKEIKIEIETQFIEDYQTQNVIGYVPGKKKNKYICITAHYDHLGMIGTETIFPGANDNASGVAMLLNIMKHYQEHPPKYGIVFMAFAAEEAGILGSKHYVEHPLFPLNQIKFLINCDISGTGDEGITVVNGTVFKKQFKKLTKINTKKDYLAKVKIRGRAANSDHLWFTQQGVPCFFIYTMGGIKAYHDVYDKGETLPLTEFDDYSSLLKDFVKTF